ncbi:type I restriction endonuclease, partial [Rhizobiaceae sp. 2RAB30]
MTDEDMVYQQIEADHSRSGFREDIVEDAAIGIFDELGYAYAASQQIAPDGSAPERNAYSDTILTSRLMAAVERLNPTLPAEARASAIKQLFVTETPSLVEENRRIHRLLTEGVDVEFVVADGEIKGDKVWLIDFDDTDNNDWLVTNQFTVVEGRHRRRADIVVFVNGLPLAIIELKNAGAENADITAAFNQLQTYRAQLPSLFRTNAVLIASDGMLARIGSLTADEERFMPWRTVTGEKGDFTPHGPREMATLLRGVFDRERFLTLLRDFIVFGDQSSGPFKIIAGYHQFHGARKALASAIEAARPDGNRKIGVIWHTQGSGKSLLMAFFGGLIVRSKKLENPTLVVLTDRNDLDDQLF